MDIDKLATSEDGYAAWYDLHHAAITTDRPGVPPHTRQALYAALSKGWPGETTEHWVARDGGTLLGVAELTFPQLDNLTNAGVELVVHPDHRRRGVGEALFAHSVARSRANHRTTLIGDVLETWPGGPERSVAGAAFAERHGASRALREVRRRMVVSDDHQSRLDAALAKAWRYASGYSLVRWTEDGAPDDVVADIAALDSDFLNQAPLGDLAWEPEKVDVARTRQIEQALRDRGWGSCHVAARHDATGEAVAWTMLSFGGYADDHAWQQITLVRPDHRGHRLGTVIKLENLRFARERYPGLSRIDTCNADVNDHMVAINDLMGFQPVEYSVGWQLTL